MHVCHLISQSTNSTLYPVPYTKLNKMSKAWTDLTLLCLVLRQEMSQSNTTYMNKDMYWYVFLLYRQNCWQFNSIVKNMSTFSQLLHNLYLIMHLYLLVIYIIFIHISLNLFSFFYHIQRDVFKILL